MSLERACLDAERIQLPGAFVEAGCALGGSAILLASLKSRERPLLVYDVFDQIPAPTVEDPSDVHRRYKTITEGQSVGIGGDLYYGYIKDLLSTVRSNLKSFGIDPERDAVQLIKGLVQETMKISQPIAVAHVDVDWYEPVMTCLQRIYPRLVVGGCIILDDYHDWGGCKKATDEYLTQIPGRFTADDGAGSMKITKNSA